jgi:hypothetical protein
MPYTVPDLAQGSPVVVAETEDSVIIAVAVSKTTLARNMRFLETVIDAATRENSPMIESTTTNVGLRVTFHRDGLKHDSRTARPDRRACSQDRDLDAGPARPSAGR